MVNRNTDRLDAKRRAASIFIAQSMVDEIVEMQQGRIAIDSEHGEELYDSSGTLYTKHSARRLYAFTQEMSNGVKWPTEMHLRSLGDIFGSLRGITTKAADLGGARVERSMCKACQTTIPDQARKILAHAVNVTKGLCIDCIQAPDGQGKHCRVQH